MKKYIIILIITFLVPSTANSTVGQQVYVSPLMYTITKDVTILNTNSYSLGEVMVGINNGWANGSASGKVTINRTIKYNNYSYTVGRLGKWAFKDNAKMTSVSIPNTIRVIETESFYNCTALKTVTINPYSDYNTIAANAFNGCISLETVEFTGSTLYVSTSAFAGCENLKNFPFDKVPAISNYSFARCKSLSDLTLNIENIGTGAFSDCTSLSSLKLTNNKVSIGEKAFNGCAKLKTVICMMDKENFTSLPNANSFSGISPNAVLYVPNGMKSYYENDANWHAAFPRIKAIAPALGETFSAEVPVGNESITLNFDVVDVENMKVKITSSECQITSPIDLVIPAEISYQDWDFSVVEIGPSAFANIQNLHSVTVGWRQPVDAGSNFSSISSDVILYVPAGTKSRYAAMESWQKFSQIIEASPISLGDVSSLVGSKVSLPVLLNNNEVVKGVQFKLTLPQGISIENKDGELKTSLANRTEGMTVMGRKDPDSENSYLFLLFSLNGSAIAGNEGEILNVALEIDSESPIGKRDMIIEEVRMTTSTFETRLPAAAVSELLVYTNIRNIDFADNAVKELCISHWDSNGDDELDTKEASQVNSIDNVFTGNTEIKSFNELKYFTGLTNIGSQDFNGCSGLTSVVIPCNVTTIENDIFDGCNSLVSLSIDEENAKFDSRNNCNAIIETATNTLLFGLKNTVIANSVEIIGSNAFKDCTGMTMLDIPNSVVSIEDGAFSGCSGLTTLNIPSSLTNLEISAFYGCSGLTSIVVDEENAKYDSRDNCNAIIQTSTNTLVFGCVNTVMPTSITAIGNNAFKDLVGITSVIIPANVTSIGEKAFDGCENLNLVKLKNDEPVAISDNVFSNRTNAALYVPIGSLANYSVSDYWKEFKSIKEYPDGDVNQDSEIDVVDVVDIARYVVGTPRDVFDENIADLNYDDLVNVTDAVTLVNYIAGDVHFTSRQRMADVSDDLLSFTQNTDQSLSLVLEGNGRYTAFQLDVLLPDGLDIAKVMLNSQRKQKHQLLYHKLSNGKYRVVALSTSNSEFLGTKGELLNITIDGHFKDEIVVENIHFVTVKGGDITFKSVSLNGDTSTGIINKEYDFDSKEHHFYNLNGQRVAVPQRGINIIDGKKIIVK